MASKDNRKQEALTNQLVLRVDSYLPSNFPRSALRKGELLPKSLMERDMTANNGEAGVLPPGLVQRPSVAITSIYLQAGHANHLQVFPFRAVWNRDCNPVCN